MSETQPTTAPAVISQATRPSETQLSVFGSEAGFVAGQRMARMLAASNLVPASYQGEAGLPNAIIAIDMAQRMGANPLMIMQNLYVVHGRPAWSSQFLIACLNACGRFSPLRYVFSGEGDDYGCKAVANDRAGNLLEGPRVNRAMVKAEGWLSKNGSKWKTMEDLMFRYRSATFFARTYAPELTMGIPSSDEVIDIEGAEATDGQPARQQRASRTAPTLPPVVSEDEGAGDAVAGKEGV